MVVHCWARHIILSNPKKLVEWYAFIFFFHLLFIGFIPFGCYKTINEGENTLDETSKNERENKLEPTFELKICCGWMDEDDKEEEESYEKFLKHNDVIRGLCFKATILRVVLVKDEREKVERLLSGLNLVDKKKPENSTKTTID